MKRVAFLAAVLVLTLAAVPALAQDGGEFCAIPEGCDLDGDGVAETPAGAPVPAGPDGGQYGPEEEFCAIPEGCETSAPPDPAQEAPASPEPVPGDAAPPANEGPGSAPPAPGGGEEATSVPPAPEESGAGNAAAGGSASASASPADGGRVEGAEDVSAEGRSPVAGVTVLPETGGVLPAAPVLGLALFAGGLLARRTLG